jgi:hypothetical protein
LPLTTFARTWSVSATPLGFGILKLRLSERRIGGRGCSLWRTPEAGDCADRTFAANSRGEPKLSAQVKLWRTPDAGCTRGAQSKERFAESLEKHRLLTLNDQIAHLFPTPRASDAEKGMRTETGVRKELNRGHGIDLPAHVQLFPAAVRSLDLSPGRQTKNSCGSPAPFFPTPTANGAKNNSPPSQRKENGRHSDQLNVAAGGALNPSWVEWLMGFPIGWTDIGI